jgi:Secretion system C-terminal sorting domain
MAMLSKLGKKPKSDVAGKGSGTISIPYSVVLDQNYPNPFNPSTTIRYALPKDASIKLAVYDLLGREVARLYEGQMSAGYHEVVFNATNLASGVYVCRLQAGELVIAKKLSVMK